MVEEQVRVEWSCPVPAKSDLTGSAQERSGPALLKRGDSPAEPDPLALGLKAFGRAMIASQFEMWEPLPMGWANSEQGLAWRNKPRKLKTARGEGGTFYFVSFNLLILIFDCSFLML
jgi:hypothetical protein